MNLDDVKKIKDKRSKRHRVGRGAGSGWGKTSGRGNKGAGQRSGTRFRLRFEGGQMPLYRRLPKKGFSNARFKVDLHVVNVGDLAKSFDAGAMVDVDALKRVGLAPKRARYLKVLGYGDLDKALTIHCHGVSAGARVKIEASGGTIEVHPVQTVMRPKFEKKAKSGVEADPAAPRADEPAADVSSAGDVPEASDAPESGGEE